MEFTQEKELDRRGSMNLNTYNFDGIAIVTLVPRGNVNLIEGDIVGFFIINNTLKFYGAGTELLFSCHKRNLEKYFELLTINEDLDDASLDFLLNVINNQAMMALEREDDLFVEVLVNVGEATYEGLEEVEVYEAEEIIDKELNMQLLNNAIDKALDNGDKELFRVLTSRMKDIE